MSSPEVAVYAENISKRFVLQKSRAGDLRELFTGLLQRKNNESGSDNEFYALRDVGFSIQRGETVGIVGHNGSGKSTLLKMLTGILKPDTGHIRTHGRIGALIEVGAGFHPDLSGRENIFLNGSIMGLSRRELEKRFDAIVSFAGLERFIDTPVKRYSSGMYMRLGFSIATHIEPEILLIDEVLAVGDTQFQNKCIKHLREFAAGGGTVIFVSHAMDQVASLCQRCLWLDRGQLLHDGLTTDAVDKYMKVVAEREEEELKRAHPEEWEVSQEEKRLAEREKAEREEAERLARMAEEVIRDAEQQRIEAEKSYRHPDRSRILSATLRGDNGDIITDLQAGQPMTLEVNYRFTRDLPCPAFCFDILRIPDDLSMFERSNFDEQIVIPGHKRDDVLRVRFPYLALNQGNYRIRVRLYSDWVEEKWKSGDWEAGLEDIHQTLLEFRVWSGRFAYGCAFMPVEWGEASA
jgi:ABC-type polysaccharide/polyol phosphate transport system ATPase subunit